MSQKKIPLVALVGLPNSGKSTLLNRICGFKKAVVADEPHTTRDLNWGEDVWENMYIRFVDTGGVVPDPADKIQKEVQIKSWSAMAEADLLIWVIDRKTNVDTISEKIIQRIWRLNKPFIIGINKVDNPNHDKSVSEYAHLGGVGFMNFSASSFYGLNDLMDLIIETLEKMGFEKEIPTELLTQKEEKQKKGKKYLDKQQVVKRNQDGSYFIVRENTKGGPGLYQAMTPEELEGLEMSKKREIEALIFDVDGVVNDCSVKTFQDALLRDHNITPKTTKKFFAEIFQDCLLGQKDLKEEIAPYLPKWGFSGNVDEFLDYWFESGNLPNSEALEIIQLLKERQYKMFAGTNSEKYRTQFLRENMQLDQIFDNFYSSSLLGHVKPDLEFYLEICRRERLNPEKTIFIDDKEENVEAARAAGLWTIQYFAGETDLEYEIDRIEQGKIERIPKIPKVLFLGKPNVGKSSLFNAMVGQDIQIVTEIAGTTLGVNDMLVERRKSR